MSDPLPAPSAPIPHPTSWSHSLEATLRANIPTATPALNASAAPLLAATNATTPAEPLTFAVIGDYGDGGADEAAVARMVATWNPAFVLTVGDNCYPNVKGLGTGRYDTAVGDFYGRWLADVTSQSTTPVAQASINAFFPTLGNHDYTDADPNANDYLTYFNLPGVGFASSSGNERYYDFAEGPVHFFALNSDPQEPDGTRADSKQAMWLRGALRASKSAFNIVYMHHPPFSSDNTHGATDYMRWPFAQWGASTVISGHAHTYERIRQGGLTYFVDGVGGATRYGFGTPTAGSRMRYNAECGAIKATVRGSMLTMAFYNEHGALIDHFDIPAR